MTPEEIANSVPNIEPGTYTHDKLVADIRAAVLAEREACALTAEFSVAQHGHAEYVSAEIRARK